MTLKQPQSIPTPPRNIGIVQAIVDEMRSREDRQAIEDHQRWLIAMSIKFPVTMKVYLKLMESNVLKPDMDVVETARTIFHIAKIVGR